MTEQTDQDQQPNVDWNARVPSENCESSDEAPKTSVVYSSFEETLQEVGSFGRYQVIYAIVLQVCVMISCGNALFMPYAIYEPTVTCFYNDSQQIVLNVSHSQPFCSLFKAGNCTNVTWQAPFYTILQEWNLICDWDYIPQLINSLEIAGTFVALALAGYLSDLFGRKYAFCGCFALMLVFSMISIVATNWIWLAACRFVIGGTVAAAIGIRFVWGMEITDQKHNMIINICGMSQFGFMLTALIAYITGSWKTYLLVFNGLAAPLLIIFAFFYESPRWLIQKGRLEKAAKVLNGISHLNHKFQSSKMAVSNLTGIQIEQKKQKFGFLSLFSHKRLATFTILVALLMFAVTAATHSFVFQVSEMGGSPFLKFLLYGVMRLWIPPLAYLLDRYIPWFGRRHMLLIPLAVVGICYAVAMVTAWIHGSQQIIFIATISGAVIANCVWVPIGQYQVELFPTVLRNTATAFGSFFDTIAAVLMPQLVYLERYIQVLPSLFPALTTLMVLVLAFLLLPETKGRLLPDTIGDLDILYPRTLVVFHGPQLPIMCTPESENLLGNIEIEDTDPVVENQTHTTDEFF